MTNDPQLQSDVRALFDQVEDAWRAADLKRYAGYYLADAGYIDRVGELFDGRAAIEAGHAEGFAGAFAGTTMRVTPVRIRRLCDTHVLVHAKLHTTTSGDDAGVDAVTTALLQQTPDGLRIAAVHTTQL
jgi:uncharacterized protein (TIGR02246 family)